MAEVVVDVQIWVVDVRNEVVVTDLMEVLEVSSFHLKDKILALVKELHELVLLVSYVLDDLVKVMVKFLQEM
ncbi:hypothetical protein Tco_0953281 [Tanacetum coccineum]|uniref:Uncharacterized protein n=1 Tax=Tanacetum coccineum TaxID=301880 RepID=A0ABQ5E2B8_9ASTR